jgi:hypothetical protein
MADQIPDLEAMAKQIRVLQNEANMHMHAHIKSAIYAKLELKRFEKKNAELKIKKADLRAAVRAKYKNAPRRSSRTQPRASEAPCVIPHAVCAHAACRLCACRVRLRRMFVCVCVGCSCACSADATGNWVAARVEFDGVWLDAEIIVPSSVEDPDKPIDVRWPPDADGLVFFSKMPANCCIRWSGRLFDLSA